MTIPALPQLNRTSPTFRSDLDAFFLTQLPDTVTALNAEFTRIDGITAGAFTGTSGTSRTIASSGSFTFGVVSGTTKAFAVGQRLVIAAASAPSNQMRGYVTAYDTGTGELVAAVDESSGSGTFDLWSIAVTATAASPHYVGDVLVTNRTLSAPLWLPADGAIYSQATYTALYAELGLLRDGVSKPFLLAGTLAQASGASAVPPEGVSPFPLLTAGSAWLVYNRVDGVANNRLARSTDGGLTWTQGVLPNPATDQPYTRFVSHDNGATLVATTSSTGAWVARSTDNGVTWAAVGVAGYNGAGQLCILNGRYVLVANGTTNAWTSTDGAAWTSCTMPAALYVAAVVTVSGAQVAVAYVGGPPFTTLYTSSDGITWTSRSISSISTFGAFLLRSNSNVIVWMPVSGDTTYRRSTDGGATWASPDMPISIHTRLYPSGGLMSFKGRFVYVSAGGAGRAMLVHSADGLTWTIESTPIPLVDEAVAPHINVVGDELWLAYTSGSTVYTLSAWGAEWSSFVGTDLPSQTSIASVQELGGVQLYLASTGTTQPRRRTVYTYNTSTQFAVPALPQPNGVTAYIKA